MANSNEDSLNAPNLNATSASKVGSASVITVQESMTIISELIQSFMQKSTAEPRNIWLPRFNPEIGGADPAAWCSTANQLMGENPLQGNALFSVLSRALEGSAAQWLQEVMVTETITWPRFKESFTARFGGNETPTLALMKMMKERPLKDETMGDFGIRLRSFLKARWEHLTMSEIINTIVLVRLASEDQCVKQMALTKDIKTEDEFLSEMKMLSCTEKWFAAWSDNSSADPEAKQHKSSNSRIRCFYCGIRGHKIAVCRKRIKFEKRKNIRKPEEIRPTASVKVSYFKCHEEGHAASDCPLLQKNSNFNSERRVDSCVVEDPTDGLSHIDTPEDV